MMDTNQLMRSEIIQGDCLEVMKTFPDNHFSAVVTDPPYGLHFMGKDWDQFKTCSNSKAKKPNKGHGTDGVSSCDRAFRAGNYDERRNDEFQSFMQQVAIEALRVLKPGGHLLMFGAPRRFHRQVCALEDGGFEIRDCLMWIFGSGFPKSHNHFGIEGYGTALKPAYEPIIMAMKPLDGTFKQNAEKWGQAGINIVESRIGTEIIASLPTKRGSNIHYAQDEWTKNNVIGTYKESIGRWPANVIFDEEASEQLGSPRRFFYCAKASRRERNEGLDGFESAPSFDFGSIKKSEGRSGINTPRKNNHPTVKPLKLMEYLIKLVMPPSNGLLLDPFAGSGTTILAAKRLGFEAIGIEKSEEYAKIAEARINNQGMD